MGTMKRGRVVDGRGSQVKVLFEDSDGVVSPWLDVAQRSTIGKQSYHRFKVGELVRCYLDRNGESGEVLHAIYNEQHPAPADSDDVVHHVMPDGSTIVWQSGSLKVAHASGVSAEFANGTLKIDGDVVITGDLSVEGKTDLKDTLINDQPQLGN
ncbi:hypothetical protein [Epibacterium ulvae]|uniref:hypothetical protein n=1 Tax=Epibacterium ulvae TaxID=1156985 RepID=UPI002490EB64|nr:hypothetical protein [Epibacterium ulvae]